MQAQRGNGEPKDAAPRRGTPQGAACSPRALQEATVLARSKHELEPRTPVTVGENTEVATKAKSDKAKAKEPNDDGHDKAAIIDALKSRQIDRIIPYLPDGDAPQMIKILDLEAKYDIHHDPPSSSDDDSEEYIPPY